jgi:hypothetical protein
VTDERERRLLVTLVSWEHGQPAASKNSALLFPKARARDSDSRAFLPIAWGERTARARLLDLSSDPPILKSGSVRSV